MTKYWMVAAVILICSGCAGMGKVQPVQDTKGPQMLSSGIKSYEDGNYRDAIAQLQGALDTGLPASADKITAHKYLAFTYCVSNRETLCREEFGKVLAIDPKFDLAPAEAGHPIWGSVFRSVKRTLK